MLLRLLWDLIKKNMLKTISIFVIVIIVGCMVNYYFRYQKMKDTIVLMSDRIVIQDSVIVSLKDRVIVDSTLYQGQIKDLQIVVLDMRTRSNSQAKQIVEKDLLILDMAKGLKCVKQSLFGNKYKIVDCKDRE